MEEKLTYHEAMKRVFESEEDGWVVIPPIPREERPGILLKGTRLREEKTQETFAKFMGVSVKQVRRWESNSERMTVEQAEKAAKYLNTSPEYFVY